MRADLNFASGSTLGPCPPDADLCGLSDNALGSLQCYADCSGRGTCVRGTCNCFTGYVGEFCQQPICWNDAQCVRYGSDSVRFQKRRPAYLARGFVGNFETTAAACVCRCAARAASARSTQTPCRRPKRPSTCHPPAPTAPMRPPRPPAFMFSGPGARVRLTAVPPWRPAAASASSGGPRNVPATAGASGSLRQRGSASTCRARTPRATPSRAARRTSARLRLMPAGRCAPAELHVVVCCVVLSGLHASLSLCRRGCACRQRLGAAPLSLCTVALDASGQVSPSRAPRPSVTLPARLRWAAAGRCSTSAQVKSSSLAAPAVRSEAGAVHLPLRSGQRQVPCSCLQMQSGQRQVPWHLGMPPTCPSHARRCDWGPQ